MKEGIITKSTVEVEIITKYFFFYFFFILKKFKAL